MSAEGRAPLPPQRSTRSVAERTALVLLALLPGATAKLFLVSSALAWRLPLAVVIALGLEAVMLKLRRQPMGPFLGDPSAPLSAVLLALMLPVHGPWWMLCLGVFVAIVASKQLCGGLGENLFNPVMAGYAVLLAVFPADFVTAPIVLPWRAGPTELIACLFSLGGLWLIWKKIIPWQTPLALLAGVAGSELALTLAGSPLPLGAYPEGSSAGLALAAFFIVTDPVTGCLSSRGRIVFGAGTGVLATLLTRYGGTADGLPFAVLIMNFAAPWIDQHTRPSRQRAGVRR